MKYAQIIIVTDKGEDKNICPGESVWDVIACGFSIFRAKMARGEKIRAVTVHFDIQP